MAGSREQGAWSREHGAWGKVDIVDKIDKVEAQGLAPQWNPSGRLQLFPIVATN